jgi:uncharacterized OB-fold protein
MTTPSPTRPQLYERLNETDGSRPPALYGKRCQACGYTFFPPHAYSCESCGGAAEQLEQHLLAGTGVIQSSATVHVHHDPNTPPPFTVASITLDAGPTIRALLTCPTDADVSLGDRVQSVLISTGSDADGNKRTELRFEKVEKGEIA